MTIVFVTGMFGQRNKPLGGMPRYIYKTACCLQQRGHKVIIVTADSINKVWQYNEIEVHSVNADKPKSKYALIQYGWYAIYRDWRLQKELDKIYRERKIDVIQYTGWFGVGVLHHKQIPAVMRLSDYARIQLPATYAKREIAIISLMERVASIRMNAVFAPSYVIGQAFEQDIGKKVYILETPYWDREQLQVDSSIYEENLKDKEYLLFFGRLSPDKGILVIASILNKLLEKYKELVFVFAGIPHQDCWNRVLEGAGEYRDRVVFLGNLNHEQLFPILQQAHAVVMPSLMDNLPNACQEAMYQGKVVVGTKGTSLDQLIIDGVSGILCEPGQKDSLYKAIERAMNLKEEELNKLGKNAKKRIECLRPEVTIGKLVQLYEKVITQNLNKK